MMAFVASFFLLVGQDAAVAKAEKVVADHPDDPAANLTLGAYYATLADWGRALGFLEKSKAPEIRSGLEAEAKDDGNYLTWVEIADAWTRKLPKSGPVRQACVERSGYWYTKAWPSLDAVWKTKLRERLAKLYAPAVPGKAGALPENWYAPVDTSHKSSVVAERSHTGGSSAKLTPGTKARNARLLASPKIDGAGKKVELSIWVLSDGTTSPDDEVRFYIDGSISSVKIPKDLPVWTRLSHSVELQSGSFQGAQIEVVSFSKAGSIFVDDLSVKVDGKEQLQNGGFEK